jgi:hypothetical protein
MTTEVHVGGLDAILKLQTVELGWINLLNQRALCVITPIRSLCVEEITLVLKMTIYQVAGSINVKWEKEKGWEMLSRLDDALVSAQFPCLQKVKLRCCWSWGEENVHSFIQAALPKCYECGLLSIFVR